MPAAVEPSRLISHRARSSVSGTQRPKWASTLPRHAAPHSVACICISRGVRIRRGPPALAGASLVFGEVFLAEAVIQDRPWPKSATGRCRPTTIRTRHGMPSGIVKIRGFAERDVDPVSGARGPRRKRRQPVRKRFGGDGRDLRDKAAGRAVRHADLDRCRHAGPDALRVVRRHPEHRPDREGLDVAEPGDARAGREPVPRGGVQRRHLARGRADDQRPGGAARLHLRQRHPGRGELRAQRVAATAGLPDFRFEQLHAVVQRIDLALDLRHAVPGDRITGLDAVSRSDQVFQDVPGIGRHDLVARSRLDQDPVRPDLALHAAEQRPAQERQQHQADAAEDGTFMGRGDPQETVELLALVSVGQGFLAKEAGEHRSRFPRRGQCGRKYINSSFGLMSTKKCVSYITLSCLICEYGLFSVTCAASRRCFSAGRNVYPPSADDKDAIHAVRGRGAGTLPSPGGRGLLAIEFSNESTRKIVLVTGSTPAYGNITEVNGSTGDPEMSTFTQNAMQSAEEMRRQLTEKAVVDAAFRAQLVSDPKGAIHQEFGIQVPDNVRIQVHESDMQTIHLALPPGPDLDEEQLEAIAAGLCCCV